MVSEAELIVICLDAADRADVTLVAMSSDEREFDVLLESDMGCLTLSGDGWGSLSHEALSKMVRQSFTHWWTDAERCLHE